MHTHLLLLSSLSLIQCQPKSLQYYNPKCSTTVRAYAAFSLFWLPTTTIDRMLLKKLKIIFSYTFPAFTTVASAIFGRTRFSNHAYAGCVCHTQGTTFTSHASYFDASIWLHADELHFEI